MDNNNSRTRKVINRSGSLLAISALCALGIWIFTPVSEETHYKPDYKKNILQITDRSPERAEAVEIESKPLINRYANQQMAGIEAYKKDLDKPALEGDAYKPATEFDVHKPIAALTAKPASAHPDTTAVTDTHLELETFEFDTIPETVSLISKPTPRSADSIQGGRVETFTIQSGDTLTRIFSRAKLPISQAIKLSKNEAASQLNRLSIGKDLRIYFDENNQWETLEYDKDKLNTLIVSPIDGEFAINQHEKQVTYRTFTARGIIESSLGIAAENAGMSPTVTQYLVDIFKWEIDFARDLHAGDSFSVVYQKAYLDDELVADGSILAASFTTGGRTIEAIRYTDSGGVTAYFQPDGESLRRGFLRTPVKLARITSGFGKRRHPIKKVWKKHLGVDYGASRGAPIVATADGVVQYSGKKGGYGNTVILRHGGIYTTLYAHMSKMGKGIRSGKAVTQGQVIGYVGRSGWATGDHLHYEFRINGKHKNPLKVKLPKIMPLAKKEMDAFIDQAEPLLGTLTSLKAAQLAKLDSQETEPTL